jgi:hypothetical protein
MIDGIRAAIVGLEGRMDRRFAALEDKIDRQFIWVVGVQVTTLAALVAAILGAILVR